MLSKRSFLQGIETLTAAFNYNLPGRSAEVYFANLAQEFDDAGFERAVQEIIRTNRRFPTVAEFLEIKRGANVPWYCRG